jgi:transposase
LSADQLRLFVQELNAAESDAATETQKDDDVPPGSTSNSSEDQDESRRRGRRTLPAHLKRERIEHDLAEEEKHCACCSQDLRPIGEESSERYEYIPAQLLVIEDVCKKYACACTVKTAGKPPQPIEKSVAGASLLAQVIVSKIADHLPVHRQAKIFSRFGVEIPDQTMGGWMRQSAQLLDPLYVRLKQFVLSSKVVGTDDTPVKVLDRKLKRATRRGRFWPYIGDREHPAAVFDYTPTRERAGPETFLKAYRGYLQADAYVAYDSFFTNPERGLVEVACWAHRGVTSIGRWIPIRRVWARCWPTSRIYIRWRNARGGRVSWARTCACCASMRPSQYWRNCISIWRRFAKKCCPRAKLAKRSPTR